MTFEQSEPPHAVLAWFAGGSHMVYTPTDRSAWYYSAPQKLNGDVEPAGKAGIMTNDTKLTASTDDSGLASISSPLIISPNYYLYLLFGDGHVSFPDSKAESDVNSSGAAGPTLGGIEIMASMNTGNKAAISTVVS